MKKLIPILCLIAATVSAEPIKLDRNIALGNNNAAVFLSGTRDLSGAFMLGLITSGTGSITLAKSFALDSNNNTVRLSGTYNADGTFSIATTGTNLTGDVTTTGSTSTLANVPLTATIPTDPTAVANNTGGWTQFKVSGSDATTTGQSLVDVTGLVTGTLSVSSRYEFEAVLSVSTTAVATGTEYGAHVTQAPTNIFALYSGPTTVAANVQVGQTVGTNADNVATTPAFLTTASETGVVTIKGFFTTGAGAGPVFSIRHLKATSGTSTVAIGSVLRVRKL
jgi:hypothetical protein